MTSASITEPKIDLTETRKPRHSHTSVLAYGPFCFLLFGPLAFGAVNVISMFILQLGAASLFVFWAIEQAHSGELQIAWNPLFAPMLAFAGLAGIQILVRHTEYTYATYCEMLKYATYAIMCFLVVQCLQKTSQIKKLVIAFSAYGFALAVLAVFQSVSSPGKLYWFITPHSGGIYGPYVNHNHYAGLMEMLVPIPLVFSFTKYAGGAQKRMAIFAAAFMACTIFLSGSRGGMIAFSVEMVVFVALTVRINRRINLRAALATGTFFILIIGVLVWLGGPELTHRLASINTETQTEISGGVRLRVDRDGLRMFTQKPILGYGLGTFPEVYPQFRSFYTDFWINQAHNDYLQLLVEMGILGFSILIWFLILLYRNAFRKLADWTYNTNSAITLAAMLACTGILVHSFVDFNLHIPANAALFFVMSMLATMEPRFRNIRHRSSSIVG
jgi:O-antigen ligase